MIITMEQFLKVKQHVDQHCANISFFFRQKSDFPSRENIFLIGPLKSMIFQTVGTHGDLDVFFRSEKSIFLTIPNG